MTLRDGYFYDLNGKQVWEYKTGAGWEVYNMRNLVKELERWYLNWCDGDWEHQWGVKIDTLDNPGWSVEIDLIGTNLENQEFEEIDRRRGDQDWVSCRVQDGRFKGAGGPAKLHEILEVFIAWARSAPDKPRE